MGPSIIQHQKELLGQYRSLPPFYAFPCTGPWELTKECKKTCAEYQHTERALAELNLAAYSHNSAETLLRYSRFMYAEHASVHRLNYTIRFAGLKLLSFVKDTEIKHFPLLCYSYSLRPAKSSVKEALVRDSSATLVLWDENREDRRLVEYVLEPIFGEALMSEVGGIGFAAILKELSQRVSLGELSRECVRGVKGEFAAAVYLLEAMRRVAGKRVREYRDCKLHPTLMPLHEYLTTLAGGRDVLKALGFLSETTSSSTGGGNNKKRTAATAAKRDEFQHHCWVRCLYSMVSFTRVSHAHSAITHDDLRSALQYRVALFAPPGEYEFNLIVPVELRRDIDAVPGQAFDAFADELRTKARSVDYKDIDSEMETNFNARANVNGNDPDMAVFAVTVRHIENHVHIAQVRQWLREQSSYVRDTVGVRFVVSVLIFTGPGKFTSTQLKDDVVPFSILDCREGADDTDVRSLYVVINEYEAVEEESRDLLRNSTGEFDILAAHKNNYKGMMGTYNLCPQSKAFLENIESYTNIFSGTTLKTRLFGDAPRPVKTKEEHSKQEDSHEKNSVFKVPSGFWKAIDFSTPFAKPKKNGKLIVPSEYAEKKVLKRTRSQAVY